MSVFGELSRLSAVRLVRPSIREHRNARVPSLDPTKGPFRAFRALRLAENEGNRSLSTALLLSFSPIPSLRRCSRVPDETTRPKCASSPPRYFSPFIGRIKTRISNNTGCPRARAQPVAKVALSPAERT